MFTPTPSAIRRSRVQLASIGVAGLLVGAGVGLAGTASADSPAADASATEPAHDLEYTPEDEAVWERFDECLTQQGVVFDADVELAQPGEEAPEPAAIEIDDDAVAACDDILDDLSGDGLIEFGGDEMPAPELIELSPEDEAVFDRYDECLADFDIPLIEYGEDGTDGVMTDADWEAHDAAWEEASAECDPILDDLSEDVVFVDATMVDGDLEGCELVEFGEAEPAEADG